jgi:hypothetical protein
MITGLTTPPSPFSRTAVLLDTLSYKKIGYLGLDVYRPAGVEFFCHEGI